MDSRVRGNDGWVCGVAVFGPRLRGGCGGWRVSLTLALSLPKGEGILVFGGGGGVGYLAGEIYDFF